MFISTEWIRIECSLREAGKKRAIFIDECLQFQRQINLFLESLAKVDDCALKVILTANNAEWVVRTKTPIIFFHGKVFNLSSLTNNEIRLLVNLVDDQPDIRRLVELSFKNLNNREKIERLRMKCRADMYVCLKNIFASDHLDTILLKEFAVLREELQEIYRHVAALEAAGARVHRQLIIRLLGVPAQQISLLLQQLEGLVEEYDISPTDGLYGWATRHTVIAQTIAQYKYSDQDELYGLLERVIGHLNPSIRIELRTLRDICDVEYGIGRLVDFSRQVELLKKIISIMPGERIPRHRLISKYLRSGNIEMADQAIRDAIDTVGLDSPLNRYKVKLAVLRAELTEGIMEEDRTAMLYQARTVALDGVRQFGWDKYTYFEYARVGMKTAERTGDVSILDDALDQMRVAAQSILDPQVDATIRRFERERGRFPSGGKKSSTAGGVALLGS